jgi:SPP1 family predicted phage head-tail adaptor
MRKKIESSRLIHKVTFLENVANFETEELVWREKIHTFAEIKAVCDNKFLEMEGVSFGHLITEGYFTFTVRYIRGITADMRILFHGRNFDIKRIIDIEEKARVLSIIALEIN